MLKIHTILHSTHLPRNSVNSLHTYIGNLQLINEQIIGKVNLQFQTIIADHSTLKNMTNLARSRTLECQTQQREVE